MKLKRPVSARSQPPGQKIPAETVGNENIPHLQTGTLIDHVPDPALAGKGQFPRAPLRKVFQAPLIVPGADVKKGVHGNFNRLLFR
jgi:hypothetical protein